MGCDIHMFCEVYNESMAEWETVGQVFKNPWYDKKCLVTVDADGHSFKQRYTMEPTGDARDYDLFGILANVRNGTWGEPLKPISEPKGFPEDASPYVKKKKERWGEDGHSHSWLSIAELAGYDWQQKIKKSAYVDKKDAQAFRENGTIPKSYAAFSSNGEKIEWTESLEKDMSRFLTETLPKLVELSKFGKVRLVFWFDN